jgi:hypothetical protein
MGMISKPGDKVVKSIDEVFRWLNLSVKPDIPDPEKYKNQLYVEEIMNNTPVSFKAVDDSTIPMASHYRKEYWEKKQIGFDGRLLHIWVKL